MSFYKINIQQNLQGSIQRRKTELSGIVSQFLENLANGQKTERKKERQTKRKRNKIRI